MIDTCISYHCAVAVEPCISGLCLNGGTCNVVDEHFYECDCRLVGFSGHRCETGKLMDSFTF